MAGKQSDDQYSDQEAQCRFEAALRGAREVGHEAMKDIPPKRSKARSEMKLGKSSKAEIKREPGKPSPRRAS